ncbi:MAG: HEAT repeat domain-containing protein [Oscillospiraceae bacterium]|nr:HEAT repeat domain-containing protein [Oscillospiraceae bacterium]
MDISIFYSLRERLYACAAAGTDSVKEDFRLVKAVEAMGSEAAQSKPLAKLYSICRELLTCEKPSEKITECIALADAIAVVQGSYTDSSETHEGADSAVRTDPYGEVSYCAVSQYADYIKSGAVKFIDNIGSRALSDDPRVLYAFIQSLYAKKMPESAQLLLSYYGCAIVPMLKSSLDSGNPQSYGNIVRCVRTLAGSDENDWYTALAKNENIPEEIRAAAVEALACSRSNTELLIDMYKTQKGIIKKAALSAIAELNPDEAAPIFRKLSENFKDSYEPFFAKSKSSVVTEFIRENKTRNNNMLSNKTDADDIFISRMGYSIDLNNILIRNLFDNEEPEYRDLIRRLYSRNKYFLSSRIILALSEDPDTAYSELDDDMYADTKTALVPIHNMRYVKLNGCYYTSYRTMVSSYGPWLRLFSELPQNILDFLTNTNRIGRLADIERKINSPVSKIISSVIKDDDKKSEYLKEKAQYTQEIEDCCASLIHLSQSCSSSDSDRIRAAAVRFAGYASEYCASTNVVNILADNASMCSPQLFKDLYPRYFLYVLLNESKHTFDGKTIDVLYSFPLTDSEKSAVIKEAIVKAESVRGGKSDYIINRALYELQNHPLNI